MIILKFKKWVKSSLASRGYTLSWSPLGTPKGINAFQDLGLILTKSAPVIFDVGANEGQTIDDILNVFPSAQIYAFEPTSVVYNQLLGSHGTKCREVFPLALGQKDETRTLTLYDQSVFNSTLQLNPDPAHQLSHLSCIGTEQVSVRRLDSMTEKLGIKHIDLLKIDTQGADMDVLKGAHQMLTSGAVRCILIELNFFQMYESETPASAVMTFLFNQGYGLVDLYEKHRSDYCVTWCTALFQRIDSIR